MMQAIHGSVDDHEDGIAAMSSDDDEIEDDNTVERDSLNLVNPSDSTESTSPINHSSLSMDLEQQESELPRQGQQFSNTDQHLSTHQQISPVVDPSNYNVSLPSIHHDISPETTPEIPSHSPTNFLHPYQSGKYLSANYSSRERAILLRFFVQELSIWFDLCDPERCFARVVPQRARSSLTLLNAVCAFSARCLARLQKYRNAEDIPEWNGLVLSHIKADTALEYQNECVRDLLRHSMDPERIQNVDLLAASIILRTDEEMDEPQHTGRVDKEVFLQVTGAFIDAQIPSGARFPDVSSPLNNAMQHSNFVNSGTSSEVPRGYDIQRFSTTSTLHHPETSLTMSPIEVSSSPVESLRQSCLWVALRQELHASFTAQRVLNFPLSKFDSFRSYSEVSDAIWADRIVILHADVLKYCHGGGEDGPEKAKSPGSHDGWEELKNRADCIQALLPKSFEPIHVCERDLTQLQVFPEIWYLENCHVAGAAYTELTKILLATFNPSRLRLGTGYRASQKKVVALSKDATLRLCGMALNNRQAPPIFLNACSAIVLCGEYFEDKSEQESLIWFLNKTEEELAYPTANLTTKLRQAWAEV